MIKGECSVGCCGRPSGLRRLLSDLLRCFFSPLLFVGCALLMCANLERGHLVREWGERDRREMRD